MYDSVKFSYSFEHNPKPPKELVFANLHSIRESYDIETGHNWTSGKSNNMVLHYNTNSISISGSLAKYHYGNNLDTLTREATGNTIAELSDLISVDLSNARVQRIDFSTNFITEYKPKYYFNFLRHLTRFHRQEETYSLYYNQTNKKLLFYDKIKEAKKNNMPIPNEFKDKNVLRYEFRLLKQLNKFFKRQVYVKDLSNKDLYYFLIDEWYKHYKAIDKQKNKIEVMQSKVQTPKDFDKQLLIGLVSSLGYDTIDDIIEQMKHNRVFSQKEYYSRIKSKYRKMSKMRIEREDTINEINEKVKEVVLVQKSM